MTANNITIREFGRVRVNRQTELRVSLRRHHGRPVIDLCLVRDGRLPPQASLHFSAHMISEVMDALEDAEDFFGDQLNVPDARAHRL